jgi:RNA polymerase sigma-70 factor (ECF subfamily)
MASSVPHYGDFDTICRRHYQEVFALVYSRWLNKDTALDLAQEAFLRLWRTWNGGEEILNPRAWLLRVARNLAKNHAKSAFQRNGTCGPEMMEAIRSDAREPHDVLVGAHLLEALRDALDQLPPHYRDVFVRHHIGGQAIADIARRLALTEAAIQGLLRRSRQLLRHKLHHLRPDTDDDETAAVA